jgi:dTDP-4-dehydrorhamnose reductase
VSERIGLLGGSGQVGTEIRRLAARNGLPIDAPSSSEVDIADATSLGRWVEDTRPAAIVNCAAFTAVDRAEDERDRAFAVNGLGPGLLGAAAKQSNIPVVHLSTDYVFAGDKTEPYVESDLPNPMGVYGASKLEGEQALLCATPRALVLRVAWVFSAHGRNFVKAILARAKETGEVRVVGDQFGAPCSARSIAEVVLKLLPSVGDETRIVHFASQPYTSWYEFAKKIVEGSVARGGLPRTVRVERIATSDYPTRAKRPANSRLSGELLLRAHGISAPSWLRELEIVLNELFSV